LRGKYEVCPPQDELNLSRSEEFTASRGSRPKAVEGEI